MHGNLKPKPQTLRAAAKPKPWHPLHQPSPYPSNEADRVNALLAEGLELNPQPRRPTTLNPTPSEPLSTNPNP